MKIFLPLLLGAAAMFRAGRGDHERAHYRGQRDGGCRRARLLCGAARLFRPARAKPTRRA